MDKTIKITLGIFIVLLVAFAGTAGYSFYLENTYRASLTGTYTYSFTIQTDSPLTNVTFFIPVPADRTGNSPVVSGFSAHTIAGVPASWKTELYDTGKATLVKITTPSIPPGTIALQANISGKELIDTKDPADNSPVYRPVQDLNAAECPATSAGGSCERYGTPLYADYTADPAATVSIASSVAGRNDWKIFGPASNEYRNTIAVKLVGGQKGWTTADGSLETGIGSYDAPKLK